jgi:transglutaminase-like putative cysteine protease
MLRPRDGHDLRLVATRLVISPAHSVRWSYDVLGNSVALVSFTEMAPVLRIESWLELERYASPELALDIDPDAARYPFRYTEQAQLDLGTALTCHYPQDAVRVNAWAQKFILSRPTGTVALLGDLNAGVGAYVSYQSREAEGTQTPGETLARGWGSCRDFAVLLAEAARSLGFGARIVTGYLHRSRIGAGVGQDTTHAWVEIYLPGAGWTAYDPTNGTVGDIDLIRVAVARDIHDAVPISGSYIGAAQDYLGMQVEVEVREAGTSPTWGQDGMNPKATAA